MDHWQELLAGLALVLGGISLVAASRLLKSRGKPKPDLVTLVLKDHYGLDDATIARLGGPKAAGQTMLVALVAARLIREEGLGNSQAMWAASIRERIALRHDQQREVHLLLARLRPPNE